jgi:hypothetical protein
MVSLSSRPQRAEDLVWRKIEGEIVILTEDGQKIHTLNSVGGAIWEISDGKKDVREIAQSICERFDVPPEQAQSDIIEFCTEMADENILQINE